MSIKHLVRTLGLALVAVLAVSAVAVASASAHEFEATGTLPTNLLGKATSAEQVFTNESGKEIKCTEATPSGKVTTAKAVTQVVTVTYKTCKSSAGSLAPVEEPIVAEYEFSAEGWVTILKPIVIKVNGLAKCTVEVLGANTKNNEKLAGVTYKSSGNNLITEGSVSKIESKASGLCGKNSTSGTYAGNVEAGLESGGTLSWK